MNLYGADWHEIGDQGIFLHPLSYMLQKDVKGKYTISPLLHPENRVRKSEPKKVLKQVFEFNFLKSARSEFFQLGTMGLTLVKIFYCIFGSGFVAIFMKMGPRLSNY